jgi:hypothetical protein
MVQHVFNIKPEQTDEMQASGSSIGERGGEERRSFSIRGLLKLRERAATETRDNIPDGVAWRVS